jgi:hypothetical protein
MNIDEVYFFRIMNARLARAWGLEDTWTRHQQLQGHPTRAGEHESPD